MENITITVNPTETLLKSILIVKFTDGSESVNIQKSMRRSAEVLASAKALKCRTYAIEDKE